MIIYFTIYYSYSIISIFIFFIPIYYFTIDSDLRHRIHRVLPLLSPRLAGHAAFVHRGQGSVPFGPFLEISHVRSDHAPWLTTWLTWTGCVAGWREGMAMAGWI